MRDLAEQVMAKTKKLALVLEDLDRDDLIDLLSELCDAVPKARAYLDLYLSNSDGRVRQTILAEAEKKIEQQFFTRSGYPRDPINLREARKVVTEYGKLLKDTPNSTSHLKLFYVETGTDLTARYGDMYESFYNSLNSMFDSFYGDLKKHPKLYDTFEARIKHVLSQASGTGWGYYDDLVVTHDAFLAASGLV